MPCGAIRITAACATALAAGIATPTAAAALDFAPCPGARGTACATLTVPLDRTGATTGTLPLRVQRLPAAGARRGTLVLVPGGPGQSAATTLRTARLVRQAARGHEIVILEPRGAGAGGFACPDLAPALRGSLATAAARARVAACARSLGPVRAFAGTGATVGDLEQLRGELGAERVVLGATGYGSVAVLAYARTHPDRVARLVLDSPVDPEALDGLDLDALRAVPAVLADVCRRGSCRAASSDPAGDLARVQRILRARALRGTVGVGARRVRAAFGGPRRPRALVDLVATGDRVPAVRAGLPAALRSARAGDAAPLLRLAARAGAATAGPPAEDALAMRLATGCRDARLPWTDATPAGERAAALAAAAGSLPADVAGAFGPAAVVRSSLAALCVAWPEGPQPLPAGPLPDVPVLVLAGGSDVRTPAAASARVAARFPQATLLTVAHGGHGLLGSRPCARTALRRFAAGRPVGAPCAASGRAVLPPPFAAATLRGARPAPGFAGVRGRTLRAVAVALEDAVFAARLAQGTAAGGRARLAALRGGRATARFRRGRLTIALDRWSAVAGVTVTGTVTVRGGRIDGDPIRVRGRGSRGTLQATSGFLVGFLAGEPVVLDIAGLLEAPA